jgi:rhodanese-related sulfurtransferase
MMVTRSLRALVVSAALVALAACSHRTGAEPFATVSLDEAERMLAQPGAVVIDANTAETFRRHHLPGARFWKAAPLAQLLPAEKDRPVVFYCASPS